MRRAIPILLLSLATLGLNAQSNNWTLERAVQYAADNNLQVQRLNNLSTLSQLQAKQARNGRLPTLNGSTNVGVQLGRTIDPTTNSFEQQTIGFQGYSINANVVLYNGGRIKNTLRQAELTQAAAETDARVTRNDIGLQVANQYLNIVLLGEQLNNARTQLALTEGQLANTDRLIEAGSLARAQRFDLVAQVASGERTIIELDNQQQLAKLSLQLLLELDVSEDFDIATPELDPTVDQLFEEYRLDEVLQSARGIQPTIAAAQLRRDAAAAGIEVARSNLRPSVSLFGSLNTNYSTAAKELRDDFEEPEPTRGLDVPVFINGMPATIAQIGLPRDFEVPLQNVNYFTQINNNFGQSAGMALQVPIYSQGRNLLSVQQAEIQRENADLDIKQAENQLRNDVQFALADLRAGRQSYRAAEVSLDAAQKAYDNTDRLFRAGAANSLDVVTATNRLDQARTEFTRSKFQLIFNRQVIQFYLGERLSLE